MRIGLVTADFFPNLGGVATHVAELGRALARAGHDVHVLTLPLGVEREARRPWQGMTVHRFPLIKAKPFFSWGMARALWNFLRSQQLDVLHVHGLRPLEATRDLGVPVLFTNHTSGFLQRIQKGAFERWRIARRMRHVSMVLAPSEELAQATRDIGYQGPVRFIANGVDVDRFRPAGPCPRPDANRPTRVLLARRLVRKNGVIDFAHAINQLKGRDVEIVIAGDGAERLSVEEILKAGDMRTRCRFLGNVANADMPGVYQSADISVLPSHYEATSISGLESMACGLPLVGTRVGGIPALIEHSRTGLLVEPHAPEEMAQAIASLSDDPVRRVHMGTAARQRACEHFAWPRIAAMTVEAYDRTV